MFDRITPFHLDLAQAPRVLHHQAAELPTPGLVAPQTLLDRGVAVQFLGQNDRVFEPMQAPSPRCGVVG